MGASKSKLATSRQVVDESLCRPQAATALRNVDLARLRKLIQAAKLAPCHVGADEGSGSSEEARA